MAMADDDAIHKNLARWITQNGGSIHRNLALYAPDFDAGNASAGDGANGREKHHANATTTGQQRQNHHPNRFSQRGIFARHGPIKKGEPLLRLPCKLALDGSQLPVSYTVPSGQNGTELTNHNNGTAQQRNASPWLRCLATIISAWCQMPHSNEDVGTGGIMGSNSPSKPFNYYKPYLESLPEEYDSLLNWSTVEIQSFLAGTSLSVAVLQDACNTTGDSDADTEDKHEIALRERFVKSVSPYLTFLKNNGSFLEEKDVVSCDDRDAKRQRIEGASGADKDNHAVQSNGMDHLYHLFREGCMCISTRAFHMQSSAVTDTNANDYQGPFLLPYIDLLNHSPRGSLKHVTTLRRDSDGSFFMVAERDIAMEEEICHSYDSGAANDNSVSVQSKTAKEESSSLNSAQLLQTFGFVDVDEAGRKLLDYYGKNDGKEDSPSLGNITPAILTKREVSHACKQLSGSSYPVTLRRSMDQSGMIDEGWECWQMPTRKESSSREALLKPFSEEIIIPLGGSLSDELITTCCLHFLPDDAIKELLDESKTKDRNDDESQSQSLLLGNEVLEDYFLGKLVLQAITNALNEKLKTYTVSSANLLHGSKDFGGTHQFLESLRAFYRQTGQGKESLFCWGESETIDVSVLSKMITSPDKGGYSDSLQKFRHGMVVSLEERACLLDLKKNVSGVLLQLDDEDNN